MQPTFKDGSNVTTETKTFTAADFSAAFLYREGAVFFMSEGKLYSCPLSTKSDLLYADETCEVYDDATRSNEWNARLNADNAAIKALLDGHEAGVPFGPCAMRGLEGNENVLSFLVRDGKTFVWPAGDDASRVKEVEIEPGTGSITASTWSETPDDARMATVLRGSPDEPASTESVAA